MDIKSKNVLKEALKNFEGTLLLVSHDRDFLQGLTSTVYEFRDHKIKEYLGDIDYYLEKRAVENLRDIEKKDPKVKVKEAAPKVEYKDQKKVKSLNNQLSNIESDVNKLEREIKKMDADLAADYDKTSAKPDFFAKYESNKKKIEQLMAKWEEVSEELDLYN